MFGLGNELKRKTTNGNPPGKTMAFISGKVWKMQVRVARRLSLFERQLTTGQKKVCLFIFCACMGSISVGLLIQGIFMHHTDRLPDLLQKSTINMPQDIALPDSLNVEWLKELRRTKAEANRLKDTLK
jgi:hypothetical protein